LCLYVEILLSHWCSKAQFISISVNTILYDRLYTWKS
jgi:hypothetical protein